jgi:hypothetical protein
MSAVPSENVLTSTSLTPPLSTCLNNSTNGRLTTATMFRRYAGRLGSHFHLHGVPDSDQKNIVYNIGVRNLNKRVIMRRSLEHNQTFQCNVNTSSTVMTDLVSLCRRFGAMSPRFQRMDLCGIGAQASRAMALYVQTGTLTCADIRAGRPIALRASANTDAPLNPSLGHVFVPRSVDELCVGAFAVILACAWWRNQHA